MRYLPLIFIVLMIGCKNEKEISEEKPIDKIIINFFDEYTDKFLTGDDEGCLAMRSKDYFQLVEQPDGETVEVRKTLEEMKKAIQIMRNMCVFEEYDIKLIEVIHSTPNIYIVKAKSHCVNIIEGKRKVIDDVITRVLKKEGNELKLWIEIYKLRDSPEYDKNNVIDESDRQVLQVIEDQIEQLAKQMNKQANFLMPAEYDPNAAHIIWKTKEECSPETRCQAAYAVIQDMCIKNIWPTPGNVIQKLGKPSTVSLMGYSFDDDDVELDMSRLDLIYDYKHVHINFNVVGLINSVEYEVNVENNTINLSGWGSDYWPIDLANIGKRPVISGWVQNKESVPQLVNAASKYASTLSEYEWLGLICNWSELEARGKCPADFQIILIDGLANGIARVIFFIRCTTGGISNLYYDTWWRHTPEGWSQLSSEEAIRLITN